MIKIELSPSKKFDFYSFDFYICFIWLNETSSKLMKSAFYFILKALFVLKTFKFLSCFFSCRKSSLIRKIRLISKFIMSQPGLQTITIHILPNISRNKGNHTMKFAQLVEYKKRNSFFLQIMQKMRQGY